LLNKVESRYLILLIPAQPHFVVVGGAGDADIKVAHFITIADDIYFVYLVGVYFAAEELAPRHLRDQAAR